MADDVLVRHVLEQGILKVKTPVPFLQIVRVLHNRAGGNDREAGIADGDWVAKKGMGHMGHACNPVVTVQ